jgi:hypothetical protein
LEGLALVVLVVGSMREQTVAIPYLVRLQLPGAAAVPVALMGFLGVRVAERHLKGLLIYYREPESRVRAITGAME